MENNKTDKESKEKIQNPSNAEIKLELREYFDKHIRDIRNLEDNLKKDFDQKVEKYKNEIDKTIKRYITLFGGIILFIGTSGIYGLYSWSTLQITSFRDQSKTNLETDVSEFKSQIKVSLNKEVDSIRGTILSRLDQEFKTENITRLIEDKAKKYTEKKSKKYISNKFKGAMISFRKRMNNSISLVANEALKRNEELSNFLLTSFKAQSDDSEAYEQLARWGYNEEYKSYPFRDIAYNTYDLIRRTYIERTVPVLREIEWTEPYIDTKTFTYDDLKYYFKNMPQAFHAALVRLIWQNQILSEVKKMEFLIEVISGANTSNSLNAKYFAGKLLAKEMGVSWQPFDYRPILKKWQETKDTIPTK